MFRSARRGASACPQTYLAGAGEARARDLAACNGRGRLDAAPAAGRVSQITSKPSAPAACGPYQSRGAILSRPRGLDAAPAAGSVADRVQVERAGRSRAVSLRAERSRLGRCRAQRPRENMRVDRQGDRSRPIVKAAAWTSSFVKSAVDYVDIPTPGPPPSPYKIGPGRTRWGGHPVLLSGICACWPGSALLA